jgi:mono/diheme cytochrome c family protein
MRKSRRLSISTAVFILFASVLSLKAQEKKGTQAEAEMHHPKGWQFTAPKGDPGKGRAVFDKFSCYSCHEVRGERFPQPTGEAVGPELSQMGPLHPLEYFTESVMNPSVVGAKKYRGPDGKSKMPSFNEDMTVQELVDLSAYLASLRPKGVPKFVSAEGKVIALVFESEQIVVNHAEIKGFMDAMVMGYKVGSTALLKGLKPGDRVRFTIDTDKRAIIKIVKLKS